MHTAAPLARHAAFIERLPLAAALLDASRTHDWCETLCRAVLPRKELVAVVSPQGIVFTRIAGAPQTIVGGSTERPPAVWLALLVEGRFLLDLQRADEPARLELLPGDLMLGPTGRACTLSLPQDFRFLCVEIPLTLLPPGRVDLQRLRVAGLPAAQGVNRVFAGMLRGVVDTLDRLDPAQLGPIGDALIGFVGANLVAEAEAETPRTSDARSLRFLRVCEALEARLGDCALSLQRFAAEQRASPRTIQNLFGEAGSSFSGHLRQRRLERCRDDLANRAHASRSIAEICLRWGFGDAAHFSRAFRLQFGTTPRAFRQAARAAG